MPNPLVVTLHPLGTFTTIALLAFIAYARVLPGEFLAHDVVGILENRALAGVTTFIQIFGYSSGATQPITDFLVAFGEWLTPRNPLGQRSISIVLHALTAFFLYLNLLLLNGRSKRGVPKIVFSIATLFFLFAPIHTETLLIAQYRGEILGALFTMIAVWSVQQGFFDDRLVWKVLLFLSLGGAAFSRETYILIAPLMAGAVGLCARGRIIRILMLGIFQSVWIALLFLRVKQGAAVGIETVSPLHHLALSSHALLEGMGKVISGHHLSITPLISRMDLQKGGEILENAAVIFAVVAGLIAFSALGTWQRLSAVLLFLLGLVHLGIPNSHIGAEHSWYLGTAIVWSTLIFALWRIQHLISNRQEPVFLIYSTALLIALINNLGNRIVTMESRLKFSYEELITNQAVADRWIDMAEFFTASPDIEINKLARNFLEEARTLQPENPRLLKSEFVYHAKMGEEATAFERYQNLMQIYHGEPAEQDALRMVWKQNFSSEPVN